jgi:NADH:ubiquinone oxidoreductase subunit 6 (subunit J)
MVPHNKMNSYSSVDGDKLTLAILHWFVIASFVFISSLNVIYAVLDLFITLISDSVTIALRKEDDVKWIGRMI